MGCAGIMSSGLLLLTLVLTVYGAAGTRNKSSSPALAEALVEKDSEIIDCHLKPEDQRSMVIFLSSFLEGTAQSTFFRMVRKLPAAKSRSVSDLKVLLIEDPGLLKSSFWNSEDPNFHQEDGLTYRKLPKSSIKVEQVKEWTRGFQGMDGGWSYDNTRDVGLGGIFDQSAFTYISIFDACASEEQAQALFELQSQGILPTVPMSIHSTNPCIKRFEKMLDEVSIVFANGGNPDILGYVFQKFAPQLGKMISSRVRSGRLLYLGRSAGSMAASIDYAYTYEPNPLLEEVLLQGDTRGLALAGSCAIRPHYGNLLWNIPTRVLQKARGQVGILTENGEGLACDQGHCFMVGKNSREGFDIFSQPTSHLPRVFEAYKFAYKKYVPPRPNLVSTCRPAAPQCGHSGLTEQSMLMLASSNFEDPDAKDAFQSLLDLQSKQHRSKVLVLDDAAFLTSAFWDERNPAFSRADGVNYLNAGLKTSQKLVREATGGFEGMDAGWIQCTECKLGLPGFPAEVFSHASAFDRCATDEQKKALFQLQSQGIAPKVQMGSLAHPECLQELEQLLEESSVLLVNSGNVDFLGYVYKVLVPDFTEKLTNRVKDGSLIFLGSGAGAILAGETFALTAAPRVELLQMLLMGDMQGLGLAGHCALRPHWSNKTRLWDITSSLYANAVGGIDIVGLQDGDVLTCSHGRCEIRGRTQKRGATTLDCADQPGFHRGRIDNAMASSFG